MQIRSRCVRRPRVPRDVAVKVVALVRRLAAIRPAIVVVGETDRPAEIVDRLITLAGPRG